MVLCALNKQVSCPDDECLIYSCMIDKQIYPKHSKKTALDYLWSFTGRLV